MDVIFSMMAVAIFNQVSVCRMHRMAVKCFTCIRACVERVLVGIVIGWM